MANEVDYDAPIFEAPDGSLFIKGPDAGEDNFDLKPTGLTLREVQKRAQQRITDAPSLSKAATQFLLGLEEGATVATPRAIGGGLEAASGLLPENYGGAALRKIGREAREGAGQIGKEYEDLSEGVGGGGVAKFARGLGSSVVPSASALLAAAPLGVLGASAGATVTGSAVASGLQSLGGTFADAFEANKKRGMSDEEAYRKSYTPAVLSGLVTGLVTKGFGGTGLEPILLGKAVPKGFAAAVKEVAKDVGMEAVEEATDEAWQAVIRSTTFNPEATTEENLQGIIQAGIAGGLMAGAVRGAQSAPSAVNDLFAGKRPTAPTPPPLPVQPAPVAPVSPATPAAAAPQVSQRVSVPVEPPPMPKISGLMLNQPLSTWSTSPSSPNILAQSPDSFGIGNRVVKLSQAGGGFGKVGTVTAITGPKVDGNPNATVTVLFDDGTTAVSGFKEFGFLENVQQAKAMSEAARGKPFEFPLPPPSPRVTLPEPPAKVDFKRTVPLDASEQLQQRINAARAAGDAATARKLAIELDMLGAPPVATPKPRRVAITPEAQAAAPKRQQALPQAEPLPEPLEGQPYDTRLETRPEATMPEIPAGELGIERGRVSPVDPDLAAAVEDIRGGYAERVARELERERGAAEIEAKAASVGSDPKELLGRLNEAKSVLADQYRKGFGAGTFDAKARTLTGDNGVVLQWRLRGDPSRPASYNNQQTSTGSVSVAFKPPATPAEVAPVVAAAKPEPTPDKDIIARTVPVQRVDIDNGTRVQEFRVRKTTSQEMGAQWSNYYATPWVVERRTVKRNLDTGEVDNGEWSPFARGETKQKAIEDGLGDTAFMQAESEDDTHKKVVAKEMFAQQWRADKKKRLEEANREVNYATNAVLRVKEDANKAYKTALKRAKLFEAAGKNEADPVKIKAIQEKLQKEWFPKRDAAEAALKKASENAKSIEAETQPPYAPQEQAPVEVLRNQPPGTPAQVAEGKPREVSESAGEGAKEARDKSKPEQMDQNEFYAWSKARARRMQDESGSAAPFMQETQQQYFRKAFKESLPINADSYDAALKRDVKRYLKLPEGYIRKGELYVFEKAIPEAAAPTVAAKEPWEMTREEYKKTLGGRTNQMTGEPFYPEGWPLSDEAVVAWRKLVDEDRRLLKAKLPTSKDLLDWKGGTHLAVIQQAISEGKPVPPAVLADYPELKQAAGKAAKQPEPAYISLEEVDTVGKTKSGQPVRREVVETLPSEAAGEGAPEKRDKSKPEQMTPEEYVPDGGSYKEQLAQAKILAASLAAAKKKLIQNVSEGGKKMIRSSRNEKHREAVRQRDRLISMGESGFLKDSHGYYVRTAASKNLPLSAAAVDTYGIKLPPGYIREGDLYVYRPEVKPEQAPSVDVGEQQVLDEIAKLKSVTGPLSQSERIDLNELRLSAQNKKLSRLSQAYLENLEERAGRSGEQYSLGGAAEEFFVGKGVPYLNRIWSVTKVKGDKVQIRDSSGNLEWVDKGRLRLAQELSRAAAKELKAEVPEPTPSPNFSRGAGFYILANGKDTGEGPFDSREEAQEFADSELGVPFTIEEFNPNVNSLGQTPTARPAPSLSKMQVEQAVRELFDGNTPPNFQVTHNYGKTYNGREVRGWYDPATGTIWLNAAYLRSPQEARAVFIEEAFHAIQNDKAVQRELSRLVASLTPEQLSTARAAYGNISEEQLQMEAVADILEKQQLTQEQRGILARLWDAVLGAVQRLYGKFTGKVFTERDAQDILAKALKAAAVGKRSLKAGGEVYAEGGLAAKAKAFFSRLFRTVEQSQQNKASGAQWKATIRNSKLGANLDEMALVGVNDLEDGKMYSRQEVLDYLQANQVEVKDVTLGGMTPEQQVRYDYLVAKGARSGVTNLTAAETSEWMDLRNRKAGNGGTHFSTYQLPGAKEGSYREVLLTVPSKASGPLPTRQQFQLWDTGRNEIIAVTDHLGVDRWRRNLAPYHEIREATVPDEQAVPAGMWRDGHSQYSSIANPIVRLRFNERTTQDGKRMLFLEEVQAPQKGQFEKMPALFQKNWREIAFKWALRHAAENGFEVIGWTTGEQQAERYDLSKQVRRIEWQSLNDRPGQVLLSVFDTDSRRVMNEWMPHEKVESVVGKDVASKILESRSGVLKGEGLKIGGEGLKKLYDVDFRNVVNKLPAVRSAGGKVGVAEISVGTGLPGVGVYADDPQPTSTIHSLPITPAISDSVMGGQAMFSAGSPQNQLDQKYFEAIQRGDMQEVQALVDEAARVGGWNIDAMHGTTHKFFSFSRDKANVENDLGSGFYLTNTEADVSENYAGIGPDLTNRIERLAETYEAEGIPRAAALKSATKKLAGGNQRVIKAKIRFSNPVILDGNGVKPNGTRIELMPDIEQYRAEAIERVKDANPKANDANIEDYTDEVQEAMYELQSEDYSASGPLDKIRSAVESFDDTDWGKVSEDLAGEDSIEAYRLEQLLRKSEGSAYATDGNSGDSAVGELIRRVFEALGYDGIIDKNVNSKFGSKSRQKPMAGMGPDTVHYIAFEPSQIKSADPISYDDAGNIIPLSQRFQQESPDIRYSLGEPVKGIANENTGTIRGDDSIGASQEPSQNQQRLRPLYQDQGLQAGASGFSVQNASRVAKDLESSGAVLWGTEPEIEAAYLDANSDAIQAGKPTPPTLTGGQVFRGPVYPGTKATSEGVSGKPRVLITRAAKSLLLLGQSNSDILAHRFLFGADKASNHRDFNLGLFQKLPKLRIVFEPVGAAPLAAYYRSYDTIIVNQAKLDGFDLSNPATAALLDAVISEELIHAAVNRLATNEEILSAWTGLSDMERKTAKDIYGITNPVDGFTDIQFANEYLRLVLQQRLSGKTTEQVVPISSQLKKILQKLVDFLKRSFGNKPENSVARQLVERIEGAIRGNAPIKQPLFPSSGEALATNISQSDATEVQGRAIEPSIIAAAGRAVADLGRQTVDEFEQAGRELEGLAYESKAFRQARSELNNLVSLHEGRLRQLPQDRVTNDMRANIRDGVSIENGQIVVGDELVAKLAQMGVQARPELVKAMQAEVYFEQQARRLVDNLGKLATLKELKDYYTRIKAPADEIENLNKLIAAKEKVVANLTPVTTNRGRGQQSIGERAGEIIRANASKVELQSKRDALNLEPVQEFFGKGIAELRDLSEKAKAAADLTRALMDSSTSASEVARLGEIYDKWAGFDATVKDALKQGTLTDEQRVAVLTDLQKSFHEFDAAKFRMDDLLNSEEKGLLKDIREAEAAIADAKVTSGLADVLVADALKAAKGEMGLTGTVGDAANIANLEASTGAITTLAMNLGRTIDQNRWLYDFLVAPGDMPAFGASVAQSLGISETALREILKVVQQSPSLASAIVTLTDDAAAKLAASPPLQMQAIAPLATSGNALAMTLAANLTSQIVQQANAQGTKANAAMQAAARQLAKSVLRLRTLQQGQALFNQTANSPAFQQLRQTVSMGASEAQKMVVLGPTGPVLRGFKTTAKEYQPELKIDVNTSALELSKTREKVWKYLQNAEQYVEDYEAAASAYAANLANPSPSQLGFDVADYNGLKFAIENQIVPMFLNMGDMDDTARAAQYLTPWTVRKLMKAPMFAGQIFLQYEQLGKMVGGFAGNTFRQQIAKYKRGYLDAKKVASQFQDLPKLQSAAMQSHNIRSEDTYRKIFNEMAHYGRLFGTPLRVGFTLPISNQVVTKADMEFLKRTLAFEEKLRREVTEIDPVTGVRYMRGGKEITRNGTYVGDLGMPRHMNRGATQFIADVTSAYAGTPKGFTPTTDLSTSSQDEVVKYWNEHLGTLKQHILDSLRTDRSFKQSAEMAAAEKRIAARWLAGNMNQVNSVQDLVDLIAAEIPATNGKNPLDTAREGLNNELLQYVAHAERIQKDRAEDNAKTSGLSIALSSENEFTKPAASLELPSEYYDYGAVTSIDRITALSRANHSALVDFANSLRLSIKELENRVGRLQKATTDKEREAILENYKGNPQEMEDVLQLLRNSLRNFEDSYRAGGPDVIPTKLGQKLLKATVGSVLAKVEIAARNLSQGQIQVLTNLWAMNYMSASLAAWKALSNVPRGAVNTGYLVARNIAGFADRRLGRDPQFQRTLKGAVDMVADAIFKSAQLALLKPRVGAANVRASFERVQNLGFDISDDWWDAAKQAWRESGQFRTQLDEQKAGRNAATWAANFIGRLANTGADAASAFVRGSVLEASDLNMNALSLGLVGNMEQRLQQVAMVFGKRLTDAGITEIDPANKDAMLRASEWLPSMNQQTAVNSLAEIRKFLESSASSEGFQLEKNLLQYYQDKMAGKPARMFNQRTYDAVQRSMIAENNAALPTNRASAGQASQLWRTMLALTGYPADAMLKLLRVSTGGSRDRKVVLQAASKMTAAIGFAAMAIIFQAAGDAGSELWKRKVQGKKPDRVTPLDADFWSDPEHMQRAMGKYLLMSAYFLGDFLQGAYGWVDGKSTIDPTQRAFVISTASQILRDLASGANIKFVKGGSYSEAFAPLRRTVSRLAFGVPELENMLGLERDSSEAARKAMAENARAKGMDAPVSTFRGVIGLTNIKRKAISQAVSDMEVAKRKGDTDGYNKAKAEAQKQIAELEAYYLKQRLEAGDSPEVAARTAKSSVWSDYQDNNPVTAALGGKRPTAEQYKQLVESSTGERGEVIRQGIKAWQDGAQALFGKPGNITKEDVAENRSGGTVKEPSYGRVSLTGGVSGRMRSVGTTPSRGRRAKIRRVSLTGRRRRISPLRGRRKKIRRVRLTA